MIYLKTDKPYTYHELVADLVAVGIEPQRAYMFLASLGIKGDMCRFWNAAITDYNKPVKVAVNKDGNVVMSPKAVFIGVDIEALLLKEVAIDTDK